MCALLPSLLTLLAGCSMHARRGCSPTAWPSRAHREAGPGGGARPDAAAGREGGGAVAVVVDAEVTGLLMMGALSPGLKRHSVSLFEGADPGTTSVTCGHVHCL